MHAQHSYARTHTQIGGMARTAQHRLLQLQRLRTHIHARAHTRARAHTHTAHNWHAHTHTHRDMHRCCRPSVAAVALLCSWRHALPECPRRHQHDAISCCGRGFSKLRSPATLAPLDQRSQHEQRCKSLQIQVGQLEAQLPQLAGWLDHAHREPSLRSSRTTGRPGAGARRMWRGEEASSQAGLVLHGAIGGDGGADGGDAGGARRWHDGCRQMAAL